MATISGKDLNARPVVSAANALQGADPSVNITFGTGSPESSYSINIRGSISLNSGSPLVLADGVEVSLSQINPNDIESVSVLKDASSCAIYGAKASAGVVLITTKAGKKGQRAHVTYNGRFGWAKNTTSTDFIDTGYDHVRIVNQFMNDSSDGTMDIFRYTEENGGLQKLYERRNDRTPHPDRPWVEVGNDGKYYYYGNFDWYGYFYNRVRSQQEHNLALGQYGQSILLRKRPFLPTVRHVQHQQGQVQRLCLPHQGIGPDSSVAEILEQHQLRHHGLQVRRPSGLRRHDQRPCNRTSAPHSFPTTPTARSYNTSTNWARTPPIGAGRGGQMTADRSKNTREKRYLTFSNQFDVTLFKSSSSQRSTTTVSGTISSNTATTRSNIRASRASWRRSRRDRSKIPTARYTKPTKDITSTSTELYENSWGGHNLKITAGGQYEDYRSTSLDAKTDRPVERRHRLLHGSDGPHHPLAIDHGLPYAGILRTCELRLQGPLHFRGERPRRRFVALRVRPSLGILPSASAAWRISESRSSPRHGTSSTTSNYVFR